MSANAARAILVLILGAASAGAQSPQVASKAPDDSVLVHAMRDELQRSIQQLRLDTLAKPYFIAYTVNESDVHSSSARMGSIIGRGESRGGRFLQIELRVGDYAFDNTNYYGAGFMPSAFVGFGEIPIDDDYQEIRRVVWLATDQAYKQALEALSQKRAALETRQRTDSLADFTRETPTKTLDETPPAAVPPTPVIETLVRDLSTAFRAVPDVYTSTVSASAGWNRTIYMNSEGTFYVRARPRAGVTASATTQATDGTELSMGYSVSATSFAELPTKDSLVKGVADLIARITEQRKTPVADAYDGPVLFEGIGAAEVFNSVIGSKLVATRRPITPQAFSSMMMGAGNDWEDLIGSLVLPRWMSVSDDPTLRNIGGKPVDSYNADEEGVVTRATTVIDHGFLKTLLSTRTPVQGVERSTGNRFGGGARPLHVVVTADSALTDEQMKQKLLSMASAQGRNYGIVVRRLGGGGNNNAQMMTMSMGDGGPRPAAAIRGMMVYKVYADGHEEPMRGAEISGVSAAAFKELAGATQARTVQSVPFAASSNIFGGGAGSGAVTYQIPSLLFANLSIRKPRGSTPRLPVVSPPTH